jgi:predicted TIM-barrel fold metal-dependent hydrolase
MIVDAHLHVWHSAQDYPNPRVTLLSPLSDAPLELLEEYMDENEVERAVLVQPLYPGEDNSYVADCAAGQRDKFAAVCVVDPRTAGAADRLTYWVRERGCRGLRLRPAISGEGDIFGDPATYPLWEQAAALGVVINLLALPDHLATIGALAERFATVPVLIDHMAHPDPTAGIEAAAFQTLLDLARLENVAVKVTGYGYYSKEGYPYTDCHPLFRALYQRYGAGRLIWGSDFPHVLLTCGYRRNLLLQERVYRFLSAVELDQIMGENAARLYWG